MKKKSIVALLLAIIMVFSLCACGGGTEVAMKETVSTDIVDFTLNSAEFSYYASSNSSSYTEPIPSASGGIFKTNKGSTFVCMEFEITNHDRDNINVGDSWGDIWTFDWSINYNGKKYDIICFDLNDIEDDLTLEYALIDDSKSDTSNYILKPGETIVVKTLGVVNMEPDDLSDAFNLTINVPNSDGKYEIFTYTM